jgi:glycosyltransferase involved in cell wall biosynthesis
MPRVTVAIAVYNGADTIRRCLESVAAQTFQDFEILVVDDGSTDGSADIAREFKARIVRQENAGLGAARKRLVEEALGDQIAFLDVDDEWLPQKLETQVAALDRTGAALIHTDGWYIYHETDAQRAVERNLSIPEDADAFEHILPSNLVIASSAMFSRLAMLEAGNFVADTVRCSDWYGWFILAAKNSFLHLPQKLVRYHVLPSSLANAGFRFHDAQRYLLEEKILPYVDELMERLQPLQRQHYVKLIRRDIGVALSSMAKYLDKEGRRDEALILHKRAIRMAPGVLRVWMRRLRRAVR